MINRIFSKLTVTFFCCIFVISCSDDIDKDEFTEIPINAQQNVDELIKYARMHYSQNTLRLSSEQNEPQWTEYNLFKQSEDTLSISIPIETGPNGERRILIANQIESKSELFLVKLPGNEHENLPLNIRRRVIINKDEETIICRPVIDKDGQIKLARLRDTSALRSGGFNGPPLPEVVVYPGSYDVDWWWWDYLSGIMQLPPPPNYTGGTGDNQTKPIPEYGKVSNIIKDTNVKNAIKNIIQKTKDDASKKNGMRERGFWVYYDYKSKKYFVGKEIIGDYVKNCDAGNPSIKPGNPFKSEDYGVSIPDKSIPVTIVHVHPPLTYDDDCWRFVGPSEADKNYADHYNIELIVVDYIGEKDDYGRYILEQGHDINDPTKEYYYSPNK